MLEKALQELREVTADTKKLVETQIAKQEVMNQVIFGDPVKQDGLLYQVKETIKTLKVVTNTVMGNGDKRKGMLFRLERLIWKQNLLWAIVILGGGSVVILTVREVISAVVGS